MLALGLVASAAHAAGPSPTDVATARELYKDGADALDAGNAKLAAEKLSAAWALVQTPVIGADLAKAHRASGHLVEAREAALAVQRLPVARDETARSTQARAEGRVTLAEGETKDIALVLGPPSSTPPSEPKKVEAVETHATVTPPPPPTPTVAAAERRGSSSPLVWVGAVTGGVGLATGLLVGAFALNEASIVKANCHGAGADGMIYCVPPYTSDLSAANTLGTISTIGFVVSGVGAALVVTGLIIGGAKHDPSTHARVVPYLGPVSGVTGTF